MKQVLQRNFTTTTRLSQNVNNVKEVEVLYANGLPVINLPLPSRGEICSFTLKPVTSTVGEFIGNLKAEDGGIDRACIYNIEGQRVASSTSIGVLLLDDFVLAINDKTYQVDKPAINPDASVTPEHVEQISNAKILISQLYARLNIGEHQVSAEKDLQKELEGLKVELAPLQMVRDNCERQAVIGTKASLVTGMVVMAAQYGILARLTWWEYSWDIMEPVTYFITAGYAMAMYGYFLLTQQEYIYPAARDRVYLRWFYRAAKKNDFNINKYNDLIEKIEKREKDLSRLRDPLELHLPVESKREQIPTQWKKNELKQQ